MKKKIRMMRLGSLLTKIFALSALTIQIFLTSCNEDPTFLGRDLLPPSDNMITRYDDTSRIHTFAEEAMPVLTASNASLLLGSLHDQVFGFSKADFMLRMDVVPKAIKEGFRIDSMALELVLSGYFGDSLPQTVRLYALTDTLRADSSYLSNTSPEGKFDPAELASGQIYPNDTLARLMITNSDFIARFESQPDSIFSDQSDFYSFFLGFYITVDNVTENGSIMTISYLSEDTQFLMYYQDDDTSGIKTLGIRSNEYIPRINTFYHDYSGSRLENILDDTTAQDTLMYISAMAGVNTKLSFPGIEKWLDKRPVGINKAELVIPIEDSLVSGYSRDEIPARLMLYSYDEENNYDYIYDYRVDNSSTKAVYDGYYDPAEYAYVFNMGVHLQSFIQGNIDNLNLILLSTLNQVSANRVILKGPTASGRRMQLKITYTEF